MKSLQIASGYLSALMLVLIPFEKDYGMKVDLLSFLLLSIIVLIISSHFVGIENQSNNGKK
jgi:hypothetical protein